ncbi:HdeD family acid-resistance protein [Plantibacter sp. Mn2098]|uniref:HdeD family acid-resistance protein n=1 Tax=Plantibacter sp. Mn2098 TaxID=3395266 RepID=UPI003BDE735C
MSEPTIVTTTYTLNSTKLNAKQITGIRWAFGIGGVATIALGIFLLAWPKASLIAVAWIFATYFIIAGVVRISRGIVAKEHSTGWRIFSVILGVLLVIGGVYVFVQPAIGILALGLTIGITWIIEGVAALFDASPDSSRWFAILYGVISIVGGIFVLVWPASAIIALLWFTAFFLIAAGIVEIVQAFTFGRTKAAKLA